MKTAVHEEWIRAVLRRRPDLSREKLERTRMLMDKHASGALVTGYEDLIERVHLPDPDDRHVLAAAIRGRADVIVTMNLKDFPAKVLKPHGIVAQHPDEFVVRLLEVAPSAVTGAATDHRESLKNPPMTVAEYLAALEARGLMQTASALQDLMR